MSELADARDRFTALARGAAAERRGEPDALRARRTEALAAFADAGFPSTRQEEWRYTDLTPLARLPFALAEPVPVDRAAVEALAAPFFACSAFVFVDGRFAPELSTPGGGAGGVRVANGAGQIPSVFATLADAKQHPFAALNTALFADAAWIEVPAGLDAPQPIHLVFVSTAADGAPRATFPRVAIECGAGSRALVVQDHVTIGAGAALTAPVTEVRVGANAALELVVLQREGDAAWHVGNVAAHLERDARLAVRTLTLGGAAVRNDLLATLAAPGAECDLDGLFLGAGSRLVDNHTAVDHAAPHCTSRELYKGILGDRSRGVFRGRIVVRPDAQKTDARQSNANVLIGDGAEIDTKPQLEIWADDVRCSHGATIGRLDETALFYLRSRGIGEAAARDLLLRGFAADVLRRIGSEPLAAALGDLLAQRLRGEAR